MKGPIKVHIIPLILLATFSSTIGTGIADEKGPVEPSRKDKCPVCGMFVYKYPDWLAQIVFRDGQALFFDGPKDLFKYYFRMREYKPRRSWKNIKAIYVKEYYGLTLMDARKVFFVAGSDVYGPMGHELVPLATLEDAMAFKKDHSGRKVFTFEKVSWELVRELDLGPRGWTHMGTR